MTENIYTALAEANATLTNPAKDGRGNYGSYLTLGMLLDHVRPVLAAHGLSITQDVTCDSENVYVTTSLLHASGESITFGPIWNPRGANIQQLGGATTYLRRYSLTACLGIAGDDDDDGQAAVAAGPAAGKRVAHGGPLGKDEATRLATTKQVGYIAALMKAQGLSEVALNTISTTDLGFEMPKAGIAKLTAHEASLLIERMKTTPDTEYTRTHARDADDPWQEP